MLTRPQQNRRQILTNTKARDCRIVGFSCTSDAECCNDGENGAGNCMIPVPGEMGICGAFSDCRVVDATCRSDAECCSTVCAATEAGTKYCKAKN